MDKKFSLTDAYYDKTLICVSKGIKDEPAIGIIPMSPGTNSTYLTRQNAIDLCSFLTQWLLTLPEE